MNNGQRQTSKKKRYEQYQGDEMYFFFGRIKEFKQQKEVHEDAWNGEKVMSLKSAIEILESNDDQGVYRKKQLQCLKEIEGREELAINL